MDVTYDDTKPFAHAVAALLEDRHPDLVTSRMAKRVRAGRAVFVDWGQNDRHKTTVAVYSLRAPAHPDRLHTGHLGRGGGLCRAGVTPRRCASRHRRC